MVGRTPGTNTTSVAAAAPSPAVLQSVSFENWKSFGRATLHLDELTLLIGANASGKSNALEALKMLRWIATGARLTNLQHATQSGELGLRGALADLGARDSDDTVIRFECVVEAEFAELHLSIGLEATDGELRVVEEQLTAPSIPSTTFPLYRVARAVGEIGNLLRVEYNNFAQVGRKPHVACVDHQAVFTQLTTPARFAHRQSQAVIPKASELIRSTLEGMLFLDPNPSSMRGYAYAYDTRLRGDGANVSSVLHRLRDDKAAYSRLLDFVRALPEQHVSAIEFVKTPRSEVMVKLKETFGGKARYCEAPLLSDGTLRVLSIGAALLSVPEGTLVVIEEIDNGVHPSRAEHLLKNIREVATERGLRVLLTTHNPAMLDTLPVSALPSVTVCYRDPATGESQLQRLSDLDTYASLIARGPLGQLVTKGIIDRYVKATESDDERTQQALGWVEALRASVAPR